MGSRSATPGPSFRATRGSPNFQQQQQQQQQSPPPPQQSNHSMRSRSYQPPRPLQQCPSRGYGGVPRVNPPAGLPQAPPPAPPAPPARSPTPGRGAASPPVKPCSASPLGRNTPQTR